MNILLGRKVKNSDRPNYYPAQHLAFDILNAEVFDFWRVESGISDLNQHFEDRLASFGDLWGDLRALCQLYMSGSLPANALHPNPLCPAQFSGSKK
ncbi:hypothetical protein FIBSPDRAFT_864446 [Athelia psychrophila]|uniref:DUF6589 domain-containing protein n=1 Tax=Athelia psychrophila TaxID=1759441 RepID=A0A166GGY4_9AGAM|nr:hypothetical protein FIBSPDRAFT_864446 [Fibularhizoctonia sp. CBS 109695]